MKGMTKLGSRRNFHAALLPLLAAGAVAVVNCSGTSDNTKPAPGGAGAPTAGAAGAMAGNSSGGATAGAPSGGSGGASAGAAGAAGAGMGKPPGADGKCVPGALKHQDDMLCYCQPASLTYCADGCFDPMIDADHCGTCTTKCLDTQTCTAGKCGASPTVLVPAAAGCGSMHLALAGTTLYFDSETPGTVKSVPVAGGAVASVAMGEMAPTTIIANGTTVYWLAKGSKSIKRSVAGAAATVVVPAQTDDIGGFTVTADGMTVYFSVKTKISKVKSDGTGGITEAGHEDTGIPKALAVEGTLLGYPADVNGDIDIMTLGATPAVCASEAAMTNKNCLRVARSQGSLNLNSFYLINKIAYWGNQAQIQSAPATDAAATNSTVASASADSSSLPAFSISNSTVFFADDIGLIYKAALAVNSPSIQLARKQMGVTSLVADANNAYWATGGCAIMTLPLK